MLNKINNTQKNKNQVFSYVDSRKKLHESRREIIREQGGGTCKKYQRGEWKMNMRKTCNVCI